MRDFTCRMLIQDADAPMLPVDVLVLDLHHLAAPAAGVERADDPVAHLVTRRELRVRIPNLPGPDLAAERLRDVEDGREVALRDAGLCPRADAVDDVPGQLRVRAWKLIQLLACV